MTVHKLLVALPLFVIAVGLLAYGIVPRRAAVPRVGELSEHNRGNDESEIIFTQLTDCPVCRATVEATFHTGAFDEDGLADVTELSEKQACTNPHCGAEWVEEYAGWASFGEAG